MEKHNLYYVLVCSINNLSEQMTTVLIRKMERRKVWGEIYSALLIQNSHGLLNIQPTWSKGSLTGELKWELAEDSCHYWLDTGNNINAHKYWSEQHRNQSRGSSLTRTGAESLAGSTWVGSRRGKGGMWSQRRCAAGRNMDKCDRNGPKLGCRAGMVL